MYLKDGDTIGIVAPSRWIDEEGLNPGIQILEKEGFKVKLGRNIYNKKDQFAGDDKDKVSDIQEFISDPEIKGILAARGGYGSARIIDLIDFEPLKNNFKWLCGYSDFTVFHSHLNSINIPSLHCSMPINMLGDEKAELESVNTMLNALKGEDMSFELKNHRLNRIGDCQGQIVGGNLSILYSLMGSDSEINTDGKILFIEDLDEYLYHVDRMMVNLKRSGKLSNLAGLIVGGMTDMNDNTVPFGKTAEEIIVEHCSEFSYPIYFDFSAGHVQPNLALRFGMKSRISDNRLFLQA